MRKGTELILVFGDIMGLRSTYIYNNIFNVAQLQFKRRRYNHSGVSSLKAKQNKNKLY